MNENTNDMTAPKLRAPHRATDESKLAALVAAYSTGETVPPVIVAPNGYEAITGSHRIAAAEIAGVYVPAIVLTEAEYTAACEYLGIYSLADATDHEEQCRIGQEVENGQARNGIHA